MLLLKIYLPSLKMIIAILLVLVTFTLAFSDNHPPDWTEPPPANVWVNELRSIRFDMQAADPDSSDLLTLFHEEVTKHTSGWLQNTSDSNPVYGEFQFTSNSCYDFENGPDYTFIFIVNDNHPIPPALACSAYTEIRVIENAPPKFIDITEVSKCFNEGETLCIDVTVDDPDDYPYDPEGSPGEIQIIYEFIFPDPFPGPYDASFVDNGDGTATLCFTPGPYFVPPPDSFIDYDGYEYLFDIVFIAIDKCNETDTFTLEVDVNRDFLLHPKKVLAYVGQQHVKVPFFLWNCEHGIAGWDILIEYDDSAGQVVGVDPVDSIYLDDPVNPRWFYAPWAVDSTLRLDHFTYELGTPQGENFVRVVGFLTMPGTQDSLVEMPPTEEWLLFCLTYDVSPLWDGHDVMFDFYTANCADNTLTDSTGYVLWGPDTAAAPDWTCPQRPDSLRLISLIGGCGISPWTIDRGDINCNGIPFEIGDAVVFINYLFYEEDALCQGDCANLFDCVEYQTRNSDINNDGAYWNVSDLVMLLNIVNGVWYFEPVKTPGAVGIKIYSAASGLTISTSSSSPIGAAMFTFQYPENLEIGTLEIAERLKSMDIMSSVNKGELKILIYSMNGRCIESETGSFFTIPVKGIQPGEDKEIPVTLIDASFSDPYGRSLPVADLTVVDDHLVEEFSRVFVLEGNYPNPLAASTAISFSLSTDAHVTLKMYNLTGQLIQTLVNKSLNAGHHKVLWTPHEAPSGLYFYKLQVGNQSLTKRAVVLR